MAIDTNQADSIVQAILQPAIEEQERLLRQRAIAAQRLAEQRHRAWFLLAGFAVGTAIGYFAGGRIAYFGLIGGFIGMLVSWLTKRSAA